MRKFINKYGEITSECKLLPNKAYQRYRKGMYFAAFNSEKLGCCIACNGIDKYEVYQGIVEEIRDMIKD